VSDLPSAKGGRPLFLETPALDDLRAIVMALAQEVAVLRERTDTAERLLVQKGVLGPDDIERYQPDRSADTAREQWRQDYLGRIFRAVKERADAEAGGEAQKVS
jgi:hypothetical protein